MDSFLALAKSHAISSQISITTVAELWKYFTKLASQNSNTLKSLFDQSNEYKLINWIESFVEVLCDIVSCDLEKLTTQVIQYKNTSQENL